MALAVLLGALTGQASGGQDRVAFLRNGNVWLMRPDGSGQTELTSSGRCGHPGWSSDGSSLVFESSGNIWLLRLRDRGVRKLTKTGNCYQPAWRPGTRQVWFCQFRPGSDWRSAALCWVDVGTGKRATVCPVGSEQKPDRTTWRTDGQLIAVQIEEGGEGGEPTC